MGAFSAIKSGLSKIGNFAANTALPAIGKVAGVVRKVGEFGQSGIGKTILNAAGYLPVIGTGAKWLQAALPAITTGAGIVEDAATLGTSIARDIQSGDKSRITNAPGYASQAADLFSRGKAYRAGS